MNGAAFDKMFSQHDGKDLLRTRNKQIAGMRRGNMRPRREGVVVSSCLGACSRNQPYVNAWSFTRGRARGTFTPSRLFPHYGKPTDYSGYAYASRAAQKPAT